jgi:hypothetical protein
MLNAFYLKLYVDQFEINIIFSHNPPLVLTPFAPCSCLRFERALSTWDGQTWDASLKFAATGWLSRGFDPTPVIRLSKFRVKLLPFDKPFDIVWESTDTPMEKPIEDELNINPVRRVAHVKCYRSLKTPAKLANIIYTKKPKDFILVEEPRIGKTPSKALDKIKAV